MGDQLTGWRLGESGTVWRWWEAGRLTPYVASAVGLPAPRRPPRARRARFDARTAVLGVARTRRLPVV